MHFRNLGGGHYWTIELRDLQFVAFVTSSSRNEIRIHTKYTFLCDEYQSRRREAPVLLWLLFCLMSQKKGAPLHSFLCILHFSKLHSWYSWFFREKHMKKHHFLILQGWPREIIKKIFFFFLLRILSKGTLMPTSHMMRQKKVTSRTVKTTCVYFSYHFLMDVNGTILRA